MEGISIREQFATLEDPRVERTKQHQLLDIITIALDGKTVRRSNDRSAGKKAIHMVSAWASANRLVLAQVKVEEKSNEITAIPALLAQLELAGCIVSIENSVHWVLD